MSASEVESIVEELRKQANPESVAGMAAFGINPDRALGISIPTLRALARRTGKNHQLALGLWEIQVHEVRILACMVDDPKQVDDSQMERWVAEFDSWDLCDQCVMNLFDKTSPAWEKAVEWAAAEREFTKRAGFALMARLAWVDKKATDADFKRFFPLIKEGSSDERNFVKKSVNWALRQIGKRNLVLNRLAIKTAEDIQRLDSRAAKWIAADALRELTSDAVKKRLGG